MDNLDYGIIGNCRSAALISKTGNIEWCCLPEFDSSSVFAKLLDEEIGGSFDIIVDENYTIKQRYKKHTAVLITHFSDGENSFEIFNRATHNRYSFITRKSLETRFCPSIFIFITLENTLRKRMRFVSPS